MKTVHQFIEELQKMPPDVEIIVQGQGGSEGCDCVPELVMDRHGRVLIDGGDSAE